MLRRRLFRFAARLAFPAAIINIPPWNILSNIPTNSDWWSQLGDGEHASIDAHVRQLEKRGPNLPFPYSSGIRGSRHRHMRELRVQSSGKPLRIFYVFDPRRSAILLIGGDKTGDKRFYERMIPIADALYDVHLAELTKERDDGR